MDDGARVTFFFWRSLSLIYNIYIFLFVNIRTIFKALIMGIMFELISLKKLHSTYRKKYSPKHAYKLGNIHI